MSTASETAPADSTDPGAWAAARRFLEARGWLVALVIVAFGLFLRLDAKLTHWVNPDEGINYSIITQGTLAACWGELANNTHPPLISIVLWLMSLVSFDPTWFRTMSLVTGCAAIFGTYLAARAWSGRCTFAGLVAATLVAVSPFAIDQSQLIRPYMLQFALLAYATWALGHRLFDSVSDTNSSRLGWFGVCGALAVAAQYSSIFALAALGLVVLGMLLRGTLPRATRKSILLAFLAPIAIAVLLFAVHIAPYLMGTAIQATATSSWLKSSMGLDLGQTWFNALGLHAYIFGSGTGGAVLLLTLGALLYGILARRTPALLALAAFAIAIAASLAGQYPFGGSRHSGYLLLFLALLLGDAAGRIAAKGPIALGIATTITAALLVFGGTITETLARTPESLDRPAEVLTTQENWEKARRSLAVLESHDSIVFTNLQGYYTLYPEVRARLGEPRFLSIQENGQDKLVGRSFRWGHATLLANEDWTMTIKPDRIGQTAHLYRFIVETEKLHPELRLRDRRRAWVVFAGWMLQVAADFKANAEKLKSQHGMQLVHQYEEYPGIILCEFDLPVFMTVFGSFAQGK